MSEIAPRDTWARLLELRAAVTRHYETEVVAAIQATGVPGGLLGMMIHAHDVDPEPLTVEGLLGCTPYYAADAFRARMDTLAADGWFVSPAEGVFLLAPTGREAMARIEGAAESKLAIVAATVSLDELTALDQLLDRLAQACGRAKTWLIAGACSPRAICAARSICHHWPRSSSPSIRWRRFAVTATASCGIAR